MHSLSRILRHLFLSTLLVGAVGCHGGGYKFSSFSYPAGADSNKTKFYGNVFTYGSDKLVRNKPRKRKIDLFAFYNNKNPMIEDRLVLALASIERIDVEASDENNVLIKIYEEIVYFEPYKTVPTGKYYQLLYRRDITGDKFDRVSITESNKSP